MNTPTNGPGIPVLDYLKPGRISIYGVHNMNPPPLPCIPGIFTRVVKASAGELEVTGELENGEKQYNKGIKILNFFFVFGKERTKYGTNISI